MLVPPPLLPADTTRRTGDVCVWFNMSTAKKGKADQAQRKRWSCSVINYYQSLLHNTGLETNVEHLVARFSFSKSPKRGYGHLSQLCTCASCRLLMIFSRFGVDCCTHKQNRKTINCFEVLRAKSQLVGFYVLCFTVG